MKHYTNKELKVILENIKNDIVYCGICDGRGIGKIFCTGYGNLGWEHYGSSAIKMTVRDLRWVIEIIFCECELITPAEWSDYHVGYVPIDKRYKGFDLSYKDANGKPIHPNVCGV